MQAVVPCSPRGADAVSLVQHRARRAAAAKARSDRETGRPGADDHGVLRHSGRLRRAGLTAVNRRGAHPGESVVDAGSVAADIVPR